MPLFPAARSSSATSPLTSPVFSRLIRSSTSRGSYSPNLPLVSPPPLLKSPVPTLAMSNMSLNCTASGSEDQATNLEPSQLLISPKKAIEGAPVAGDSGEPSDKLNGDDHHSFINGDESDDVFGQPVAPTIAHEPTPVKHAEKVQTEKDNEVTTPSSNKHAPRADRVGSPITPANAQGLLPPEACVLSMARTDEQLEASCHSAFDVFGSCLVKVRRDRHKHPFALVQFYSVEDANRAVQGATGFVVNGRRIRTEPAQARRSIILVKVGGGTPTVDEARELLGKYGPIEKLYPTTHSDARKFSCPEGMWVEFAYYLDCKDAMRFFESNDSGYRLHVPPMIEPRIKTGPTGSPAFHGFRSPRSSTDQKSIFVGNLPSDVTEYDLRHIFSNRGEIRAINIIRKPIQGGIGYNVFGFIEFATSFQASDAAQQEVDIRGQRIRVEPKEYSARRHTRLQHYSPGTPYPTGNRFGYPQVYNHIGMPHTPPNNPYFTTPANYNIGQHMDPFGHGAYNMYHTPPPSSRGPRHNTALFSGSPHGVAMYPHISFPPPPFGLDTINEHDFNGPNLYHGN